MVRLRPRFRALPLLLFVAGLLAAHAGTLVAGFVNDDYLFLEQGRRLGVLGAIQAPGGLGNYFRPLSREVWFALLTPLTGGQALGFHLANLLLFGVALVLLADLLAALLPGEAPPARAARLAGVAWFALLPFQRVNLLWISGAQDLLALTLTLAALAAFRRQRNAIAVLAAALAMLAKESALPLPAACFLWAWLLERQPPRRALGRALPLLLALLPWFAGEWWLRQHSAAAARFVFDAGALAATFVHLAQALAGVEHAAGWLASWSAARPSVAAFVLLAAAAALLPDAAPATEPAPPGRRRVAGFALGWCVLFALPAWPVAYIWSGYYYTLAAVGGAVLLALALPRLTRWSAIALVAVLVWWSAAGSGAPAFALEEDAWSGTSHVTPYYLQRAASLSRDLRAALRRAVPRPEPGTRFFFATLPSWAGFQMGNGASIRHLYRDDSLESHFYSAFAESTAARHPCRFLFWNGADFDALYTRTPDPFFQVGTDLLLLDRPAGAVWAFRRALESGGERLDNAYWLGWAALWNGQRGLAERAWREWGAADDSSARVTWLRKAKGSLEDGDTLLARRQLVAAVKAGVGDPVAHAMLGLLMQRVNAKYALLETKVAAELDPRDWLARRDLVAGLLEARLEDSARRPMEQLRVLRPDWASDSSLAALDRRLRERGAPITTLATFGSGGRR